MNTAQAGFFIEIIYFVAISALCLGIYVKTKRVHRVSEHPGIGYFRNAFLFFSLTYLFRFILLNLDFLSEIADRNLIVSLETFSMFLVVYFSLLAVFYLAASFSWKDFGFINDNFLHLTALFISGIIFFTKLPVLLAMLGFIAIIFLILKGYSNYKSEKGRIFSKLFVVYTLLLAFWFFDLVPFTQSIMRFELNSFGYLISVCIFIYIYYRITKVLAVEKEEE